MTAPWSIEFNEKILVLSELVVKVGIGEDENTFVKLCTSGKAEEGGEEE